MFAALTGIGLSAAAGLNAYIPFLIVAGLARFTDVITLPSQYAWMESWWALGIGAVLLVVEMTLDKVAVVDTVNDIIQTAVRPSMGGLMVAATTAAEGLDSSAFMKENPWVGVLLGIVVSALVHSGKAIARPAIDAGSVGMATPFVSAGEDATSVGMSLVAIFIPVLVIVGLIAMAIGLVWLYLVWRRWQRRRLPAGADAAG